MLSWSFMIGMWSLLISQVLLNFANERYEIVTNYVDESCFLITFSTTFQMKCSGNVPKNAIIKYKDKHVHEGTPYSVFITINYPLYVLIVFDLPSNAHCVIAEFSPTVGFMCNSFQRQNSNGYGSFYQLYCFNYSVLYAREFAEICEPPLESPLYKKNYGTLFMYTKDYTNASNEQFDRTNPMLVSLIHIIASLFYFRKQLVEIQ